MITMSEATHMQKIYTGNILHCPVCNRNSNFLNVVKKDGDKYYLGTKCPHCSHFDEFKNIPSRQAQDYPAPTK
jgi:phage FluMu protein Com